MSIASELNNYRNGLDDAWDAAEDMGATIPHDRNMVNLDDAIRTIPVSSPNDGVLTIQQNGTTLGTFTADQATNTTVNINTSGEMTQFYVSHDYLILNNDVTLYKEEGLTTAVTAQEFNDAYVAGPVRIVVIGNSSSGLMALDSAGYYDDGTDAPSSMPDVPFYCFTWGYQNETFEFTDPGNTGTVYYWGHKQSQGKLTAGSNITISGDTISATDTTYSDFTGATSSVAGSNGLVPAPAAGDQEKVLHGDGTWKDTTAKLVEMSYGESNAWAKFIAAYNAGSIVYCRASSNANPGSGSQTRKAFMAYVNNATSPTNVEFQYVRSASSKTDSQQTDQVFVYTLTNSNGGTWSVASRNMGPKINVSGPITKTFTSGANATITIGADAMTGATSSTAGAAGVVPKPNSGDQDKFLKGNGTWAAPILTSYSTTEQDTNMTWINGEKIYRKVFTFDTQENQSYSVDISGSNIGEITNMFTTFKQNQDGSGITAFAPYANNNFDWIILVQRAKTSNTDTLFYYHGSQVANLRYGTTVLEYTKTASEGEGSGGASD